MNIQAQSNEIFILSCFTEAGDCKEIIGVCNSWDDAKRMINEYFGKNREVDFRDVRDSSIEFSTQIFVENEQLTYYVSLHSYPINSI